MIFNVEDIVIKNSAAKKSSILSTFDPEKTIKMHRKLNFADNPFFTKDKFPHGFVFYDFEVFLYDWLVVLIDPINHTKDVIVNDKRALKHYYNEHKTMVWVGYNNLHYDVLILKGILLGMNPKKISDEIIIEGKRAFDIFNSNLKEYSAISLLSYDCSDGVNSLKVLEAFMGDDIEETDVPFDLPRQLTLKEIQKTIHYCIHDVEETIEVFILRIDDYNANAEIIERFDMPFEYIPKTKGQLTAVVVDCKKKEHNDEFNFRFVDVLKLDKYSYVKEWFENIGKMNSYSTPLPETPEYEHILKYGKQIIKEKTVGFETLICGIPHQFGFGGVHGAPRECVHLNGKLYHLDVTSFYPSEMIVYGFLTRNCRDPAKFKDVYDIRVALKKAGKKKEQAPYKIILNSQYGITKDKFSEAYDPLQANNICINGQLLLLDLLEKLEKMGDHFRLIQSNTDGIIIWIDNEPKSEKWMHHIVNEWILRTGMGMGCDAIGGINDDGTFKNNIGIIQKDVNNYCFFFENGKEEVKGAYVKELSKLDNDLPIVNKALKEYIFRGVPVEETINNCNEMIMFQKIFRVSHKFKYGYHNGKELPEKTYRIYASTDINDSAIARVREHGGTPNTFGNSPEHCFIYNKSVKDIPMSIKVDKKWYIKLAKKRLEDFGYNFRKEGQLFKI